MPSVFGRQGAQHYKKGVLNRNLGREETHNWLDYYGLSPELRIMIANRTDPMLVPTRKRLRFKPQNSERYLFCYLDPRLVQTSFGHTPPL